ncbi:hypothetical protein [Streptomyces sp. NPDC051636]|uniref:hypothetical protein n=1 Tax=Streptomyces sp. NPDC051636 TaxID=3365663 RepID=UPI003795D92F
MSAYLTALAGAMTAVGVGAVAMGRSWPGTTGRHRAGDPAPTPLLRPVEALDRFEARCPVELRTTLHVRFRTGGVQCLDCRTTIIEGDRT